MFTLSFAEGSDPKVVEEIDSIMKDIEEHIDVAESGYDAWLASHDFSKPKRKIKGRKSIAPRPAPRSEPVNEPTLDELISAQATEIKTEGGFVPLEEVVTEQQKREEALTELLENESEPTDEEIGEVDG
jgi:hypothetical protein